MKKSSTLLPAATLAALAVVPSLSAVDYTWIVPANTTPTAGSWNNPDNWNPNTGTPSTASDNAIFASPTVSVAVITPTQTALPTGSTAGAATLVTGTTTVGSITQTSAVATNASTFALGTRITGVSGTILRTDAITNNSTTGILHVLHNGNTGSGGHGSINTVSGGVSAIGGTLTLNSANTTVGANRLGGNLGQGNESMSLLVQSGHWTLGSRDNFANSYTGLTTITGATTTVTADKEGAGNVMSKGDFLVRAGTLSWGRLGNVSTQNNIVMTGGTLSVAGIGGNNASTATHNQLGSLLISGTATTTNMNGASMMIQGAFTVENNTGFTFGQSGTRHTWSAGTLNLGASNSGTAMGIGGSNATTDALKFTSFTVGSGGLNFNTGTTVNQTDFTKTVNATGGYTINVGSGAAFGGRLILGGDVSVAANTTARIGSGDWQTGQTFNATGLIDLGGVARTFNVAGTGTLQIATNNTSAASTNNVNVVNNNVVVTNGGITKTGLGTMTLGAGANDVIANTYTGLTTVSAGTFSLNKGVGINAVAGDILVNGGTLTTARGQQIADTANLTVSSGSVTFGGNETIARLGGDGTINLGANALTASAFVFSTTETLTVSGAGSLNFTASFGIDDLFGLTSAVSDGIYTLIDGSASIASTFQDIGPSNAYNLGDGKSAYFNLNATNDLQVIVASAIPEPSSFAALAGLVGLGFAASRRRRSA